MSTAAVENPARSIRSPRRIPRFPLAVPVEMTVLRSGVPDSIPGRLLNIGEGGIAAILAAELRTGDSVGVSFRLPDLALAVEAKAVVRHRSELRCGVEFLGLSAEQQAMLRYWTRQTPRMSSPNGSAGFQSKSLPPPAKRSRKMDPARLRRFKWLAVAILLTTCAVGWWHWYRAWQEIESRIPPDTGFLLPEPARVPAEVMDKLVTHKIQPVYPAALREQNMRGVVLLETVVGADGSVIDAHPLSGPEALTPAAIEAVKWWRFQPYHVKGKAVTVETTLAIEFRPEARSSPSDTAN
jgi:TonB family protein